MPGTCSNLTIPIDFAIDLQNLHIVATVINYNNNNDVTLLPWFINTLIYYY